MCTRMPLGKRLRRKHKGQTKTRKSITPEALGANNTQGIPSPRKHQGQTTNKEFRHPESSRGKQRHTRLGATVVCRPPPCHTRTQALGANKKQRLPSPRKHKGQTKQQGNPSPWKHEGQQTHKEFRHLESTGKQQQTHTHTHTHTQGALYNDNGETLQLVCVS